VHDQERVGDVPSDPGAATGNAVGRPRLAHAAAVVAASAVCLYAWWAVGLTPFSLTATLAVVPAGGAAIALGWRTRPDTRPAPRGRVGPWLALVLVTATVQLSAYFQQPRHEHPTISSLINAVIDSHPARAVGFVAWLLAAVALARR
jgi:glucose dehydrogenase